MQAGTGGRKAGIPAGRRPGEGGGGQGEVCVAFRRAGHPPGGYANVAFAESLPAVATIVYVPLSSPSGTHHSDG